MSTHPEIALPVTVAAIMLSSSFTYKTISKYNTLHSDIQQKS